MKIAETYDLFIYIDGKEIQIDAKQVSFSLDFSIWNLIPTANIFIEDQSSLLNEYLLTVPGTPLKIKFGYDNIFIEGDYIIANDIMTEITNPLSIGGKIQIPLIHKWLQSQEVKSVSYKNTIENIVSGLASKYPFSALDIDSTENANTWYQLLYTDIEFIEKLLLKKAFSKSANNTPFFAFINEFNAFCFKSWFSMTQSNIVTELKYTQTPNNQFTQDIILDLSRKRKDYRELLKYEQIENSVIDIDTGELEKSKITIFDLSNLNNSEKIPFRGNNLTTNYRFYDKNYDIDDIKGEIISDQKGSLDVECFNLIIPFNPKLNVGKNVTVKFFVNKDSDSTASSLSQYSGKYLIAKTSYLWDAQKGRSLQKLNVIRKGVAYNQNYIIKDSLKGRN